MNTTTIITAGIAHLHPALEQALIDLPIELFAIEHTDLVRAQLEGVQPLCFVVDPTTEVGRKVCLDARLSNLLADVPIVALVRDPWGPETLNAFVLGVDDFLPALELGHVRTKVRSLLAGGAAPPTDHSQCVVMADADRNRRVHLARHLRRMGMDVRFAHDDRELRFDPRVKLVVAHAGLPFGGAAAALASFRRDPAAQSVPWVFVGTPRELDPLVTRIGAEPAVCFFDIATDPAQIVSTANRLLRRALTSQRRCSARLPYETTVRFDIPDSWSRVWAISYNLSLGGLFVRTLTSPPIGSTIEATFTAPSSDLRITLAGHVVWRIDYGDGSGHPAGFGLQFAEPMPDNERRILESGYEQLFFWSAHVRTGAAVG